MKTELWAMGLVIGASLLGSLGPIMLKKASSKIHRNLKSIIQNKELLIGLTFYGMGTILFIPALKGGELSVLYPLVSVGYIWVTILSSWILKEKITTNKIIGLILIIVGVITIGLGA